MFLVCTYERDQFNASWSEKEIKKGLLKTVIVLKQRIHHHKPKKRGKRTKDFFQEKRCTPPLTEKKGKVYCS